MSPPPASSQSAHLAEQPDPVVTPATRVPGHPSQVREIAGVHGEDQVAPGQPGRLELPGPVGRAVEAAAGQRGPGARIHRVADVPVPGARAVHHDGPVEAGRGQLGAQHGLGHR